MTGEGQSVHRPALRPRGVDVEDAEADRQADAAVDDLEQVRVLGRIVALGIAGITVGLEEHGVEVTAAALQRLAGAGERRHVLAEPADVGAVTFERCARHVQGTEQQRGIGQVDLFVREGANGAERTFDRVTRHQVAAGSLTAHQMAAGGVDRPS